MISDVIMDKSFTCLTYALSRVGRIDIYPIDYNEMVSGKFFEVIKYSKEKLKIADIVVWSKDLKREFLPTRIIQNKIISSKVIKWVHYAVYEGSSLFTDCGKTHEGSYPYIKRYHISEVKKASYILRKKG